MRPPLAAAAARALIICAGFSGLLHAQTPQSTADSVQLTLQESLARAQKLSTEVLIATDSLNLSGARVLTAYGAFLPGVTGGAYALSAQGTTFLSGTALQASQAGWYAGEYQVSTALNIFNGFRDRAALKTSKFLQEAAGFSLQQAKQHITFDVLQSYFQVVLDHELIAVANSNLALSRSRQARLESQVQVGFRSPPDLFRQRAQTASDEAGVIDIQARAQTDLVGLLRRLRLEATRQYAVLDPPLDTTALPADSLDVSRLVNAALAGRPDLHAAQARASAADAAIAQATGEYLPQVVLGADFGVYGRNYEWERQNGVNMLTESQRPIGSQLDSQEASVSSRSACPCRSSTGSPRASMSRKRAQPRTSRRSPPRTRGCRYSATFGKLPMIIAPRSRNCAQPMPDSLRRKRRSTPSPRGSMWDSESFSTSKPRNRRCRRRELSTPPPR